MMIDTKALLKASIAATILLVIDFVFHFLFTPEMESTTYFGTKFVIAAVIAYVYFSNFKTTIFKSIITALTFTGIFSLFYRYTEIAYSLGFLGRVPDLTFFGTTYNVYSDPITSITWWTLIHGSLFIGLIIADKYGGN